MDVVSMLDILYEDNHLIAVAKGAGVPSTHYDGVTETIDRAVKSYLKAKYEKPGNVFLGIVHRLDKPTSGVLLFARTSKAAARLSEQFREGAVDKVYWAVVEGAMTPSAGTIEAFVRKNSITGKVEIVAGESDGGKRARTHYESRATAGNMSWIELRPQTGRTHQLRVHLSHRGFPIVGDFAYGSEVPFPGGIALHARSLTVLHPTTGDSLTIAAKLPNLWHSRFATLFRNVQP